LNSQIRGWLRQGLCKHSELQSHLLQRLLHRLKTKHLDYTYYLNASGDYREGIAAPNTVEIQTSRGEVQVRAVVKLNTEGGQFKMVSRLSVCGSVALPVAQPAHQSTLPQPLIACGTSLADDGLYLHQQAGETTIITNSGNDAMRSSIHTLPS
jgi:hypothetical protein